MAENTTTIFSRIYGKCLNVKITAINRLKFAIPILSSEQGRNYCGCAGPKTLLSFIAWGGAMVTCLWQHVVGGKKWFGRCYGADFDVSDSHLYKLYKKLC